MGFLFLDPSGMIKGDKINLSRHYHDFEGSFEVLVIRKLPQEIYLQHFKREPSWTVFATAWLGNVGHALWDPYYAIFAAFVADLKFTHPPAYQVINDFDGKGIEFVKSLFN